MTAPNPNPPPLSDLQWSLDDLVLGPGSGYIVSTFSFGVAASRTQDMPIAGLDGDRFGVDTLSGRLITLTLATDKYTEFEGASAASRLETVWDGAYARSEPGRQQILRWRRGQRVRRAYGRSRDAIPDHSVDWTGLIRYTATFRTSEPRFYDDVEQRETLTMVPEDVGGLVGDLIGDIVASGFGTGNRGFIVGGDLPTWMSTVIYGPISNPTIEFSDQWSLTLNTTIADGDYVLVDPVPWEGPDVRRNDGANLAGALSPDSQILSGMKLPPGRHAVTLRGVDPTGTASAAVYWRDCYASH